jgi:hypothetical protein
MLITTMLCVGVAACHWMTGIQCEEVEKWSLHEKIDDARRRAAMTTEVASTRAARLEVCVG